MTLLVSVCISYQLVTSLVEAQNSTSSSSDNTQKALITLGVLGTCIVIAVVVAKIVDYCYDHHIAISDDASDISEHTRDLIRSRVTVAAFMKRKDKVKPSELSAKQKKIIRVWSAKAKESRRIAEQHRAKDAAHRNDIVIKVEEAASAGRGATKGQSVNGPSATLTVLSEQKDRPSSKTGRGFKVQVKEKGSGRPSSPAATNKPKASPPPKPAELKKTLSGVDVSNNIGFSPALVTVSSAGKGSVAPSNKTNPATSPRAQVHFAVSDLKTLETFRSEDDPELAALTDRTDAGSKSPGPNAAGQKTPPPKSPVNKPQPPKSPVPQSPAPKAPVPKSPVPKPPAPRPPSPKPKESKEPKSPPPKTPNSKPQAHNTPESTSPPPKTPVPKTPPPKTPPPKAPTPKSSPSNKQTESKPPEPAPAKTAPPTRPRSTGPAPYIPKAKAKNDRGREASPEKSSGGGEKKDAASSQREGPQNAEAEESTYRLVVEPAKPPRGWGKPNEAPASPSKPRPASSLSRQQHVTLVRPSDNPPPPSPVPTPASAKTSVRPSTSARASGADASPPSPAKQPSQKKPRPKSLIVKDDPKYKVVHSKLQKSSQLYNRASSDLQIHKEMISKKKAAVTIAVSPAKATTTTSTSNNNNNGNTTSTTAGKPHVSAAPAKKPRSKSAKS